MKLQVMILVVLTIFTVHTLGGKTGAEIKGEQKKDSEQSKVMDYQAVDGLGKMAKWPVAETMSLEEYLTLKEEYIQKRGRAGDYALIYREKEEGEWRVFWLMLDSFDSSYAYIGEITQYKSKGWDWIKQYKIKRSPDVDRELRITEIINKRSQVIGGIKYGMSVKDVLRIKGKPQKVITHARGGTRTWIYDDAKVSVWDYDGKEGGWVSNVGLIRIEDKNISLRSGGETEVEIETPAVQVDIPLIDLPISRFYQVGDISGNCLNEIVEQGDISHVIILNNGTSAPDELHLMRIESILKANPEIQSFYFLDSNGHRTRSYKSEVNGFFSALLAMKNGDYIGFELARDKARIFNKNGDGWVVR